MSERKRNKPYVRFHLATKFLIGVVILVSLLMVAVILVVERQMRESILDEFIKRGRTITTNLAAINTNFLATYNFLQIEQNVRKVADDNDLLYAVVLFYDGEVASYAGPDNLAEYVLSGPFHQQSLNIKKELIRHEILDNRDLCEIAIPVFIGIENWGTVRCGFSVESIREFVIKTRISLISVGLVVIFFGCCGALFLAKRITHPLGYLVQSVDAMANGNYDHAIHVNTRDEIDFLAKRFDYMRENLKTHIDDLEMAKKAAEAASIAKTQFLTNVSHETRTPLHAILGMSEVMLATDLTKKQRALASALNRSGENLMSIIDGILDFSKMESDKMQLVEKNFDLVKVVEDIAKFSARSAHEKGLTLTCQLFWDVPRFVRGDPIRIRQILSVLVGNAIKFSKTGEIVIKLRLVAKNVKNTMVRFEVADTGEGIREEHRDMIFDLFSQADVSLTRLHEGLGVGLAIAKHLTAMMKGEIGVESELGKGSEFWFEVRMGNAMSSLRKPSAKESRFNAVRLLLVHHNPTHLEILSYYCRRWHIRFECAENGSQALALLKRGHDNNDPFQIALIGMKLPEIDGPELCLRILSEADNADMRPVMLISAGTHELIQRPEYDLFSHYLQDPLAPSELLGILQDYVNELKNAPDEIVGTVPIPDQPLSSSLQLHLMIVEDNPVNLELLQAKLDLLGCTSDVALNGKHAVEAFRNKPYDLVAMDCQMPEMDGYEATRKIRKIESVRKGIPRTPIIAMTAHAMDGDRERCLEAGMDDYLIKPFTNQQLKEMLERWVPRCVRSSPERALPDVTA